MKLSRGNKSPGGLRSWTHPLDGQTARQQPQRTGMRLCGLALLLQALLSSRLPGLGFPAAWRSPGADGTTRWGLEMQAEFGSSLKLSRKLLAETKILTRLFVSERLANAQLPFLPTSGFLPPVSLRSQQWLALPALARLREMRRGLLVFRGYVEVLGRREQELGDPGLARRLQEIDLDLRDLTHHIDYQVWGSGWPALPPPPLPRALQHVSEWSNLQESYLILRALETFLGRAVRDFTHLRLGVTGVSY
ncbi:interleukin-27 subunit alpha isoform X1 [Emydura macquarii macquarii]|uniref:interleukin-27 subunit alpha isoform X1 n=1 Tax=Emydura macquarii macquarii TaxID=1129001 RepID=UPI00352B86EA